MINNLLICGSIYTPGNCMYMCSSIDMYSSNSVCDFVLNSTADPLQK